MWGSSGRSGAGPDDSVGVCPLCYGAMTYV